MTSPGTAATAGQPYHHGDLRATVISAALEAIAERGTARLSLRELARRAGVSHAAPAHHFGDKTGLLTAVATEGFDLLAEATSTAWQRTGSFLEVGVAYVRFAATHRAHFAVMFEPGLYRTDDPALAAARTRARAALDNPARATGQDAAGEAGTAALAGWALMHGLATLWLTGNLAAQDPEPLARAAGAYLFMTDGMTDGTSTAPAPPADGASPSTEPPDAGC
jgi:AcrR family transcriptional regulator